MVLINKINFIHAESYCQYYAIIGAYFVCESTPWLTHQPNLLFDVLVVEQLVMLHEELVAFTNTSNFSRIESHEYYGNRTISASTCTHASILLLYSALVNIRQKYPV